MNSRFFTNEDKNTLFNKLDGVFKNNINISSFDVLVGYFRSSGYFKIRPLLVNVANIRILVGIDVDEITANMQKDGLALFRGDPKKTIQNWQEKFIKDIQQANYDQQTEHGIMQFIADIKSQKVQLKAHPSKKIHAKIYIFRPDNFNEHSVGSVITGSSNLTKAGLGTDNNANYEFNVLLNDYEDIKFATDEFEKLWAEGVEILPEKVGASKDKTYLNDTITPYELYLKMLIEYFGEEVEFNADSIKDLPQEFKRLSYQLDAVNEGWQMLKKHNGFFLSDVVGLGKTVIATLIARQFWIEKFHNCSILLVIPQTLKQNWQDTFDKFQLKADITIITTGSLHKVTNAKKYDLVIVDEAHKFRNDTADAYNILQRICKAQTQDGKTKKVILVSATPLNNRPDDLYNQILLFQDGNNSSLGFSLSYFFSPIKKRYQEIQKLTNKTKAIKQTSQLYEQIRERVIEPLMVRRTRTDLDNNNRYNKDLIARNIIFPKVHRPQPIYYQLPQNLERLYDATIVKIDNKKQTKSGLLYTRYRALHYLKPELKQQYQRTDFIVERLVAIMKTLLLKRMDSSFYAFGQTLGRFLSSSRAMLKMIKNNKIIIAPNIDVNSYVLDDNIDKLLEIIASESLTDPSIVVCKTDDFEAGFITGIEHDHKMLEKLVNDWQTIQQVPQLDPKIDEFLAKLPLLLDKQTNPEQRIVIFTESNDTRLHITEKLQNYPLLSVNANSFKQHKQAIKNNFDANITKAEQKSDFSILITTDVLAEGINLHRANTVINYDTPWNATKLMQRIGRVNRIGNTASDIFVHNFYPTAQINSDIELEKKALIKLQAFHSALGEDSQIYSPDEQVGTFALFDENIQAEQSETLPFLEEIKKFKEDNPEDYRRIKALPSKLRNAVSNNNFKNSTIIFARTNNKESSSFYLVDKHFAVQNYGFIKSAKMLKCDPSVKAKPLHSLHHKQVSDALVQFKQDLTQNIINQTQNQTLSTQDKKAINFLKSLANLADINNKEKTLLNKAITQIEVKKYQNLVKELNKLQKNINNIKPIIILEKALLIVKKYNSDIDTQTTMTTNKKPQDTTPTIIISQSYT